MHCMRKRQKLGQDVRNRRKNTIPAMRKPDHPNPKMMQMNATNAMTDSDTDRDP